MLWSGFCWSVLVLDGLAMDCLDYPGFESQVIVVAMEFAPQDGRPSTIVRMIVHNLVKT
jgi:hypothetical protein